MIQPFSRARGKGLFFGLGDPRSSAQDLARYEMHARRLLLAFLLVGLAASAGGCRQSPAPPEGTTSTPVVDHLVSPPATPAIAPPAPAASVLVYGYRVVAAYPHDPNAFTQGLAYEDGVLYESTGLYGRSSLRRVSLGTGQVLRIHGLLESYYGEGVAIVGERIVQLTWQSHVGIVYDKRSFRLLRLFTYPTEGWGLAYDGERLIMSDGTPTLHFLDPQTFRETGQVQVYDERGLVRHLNELEYVEGEVYANVWQEDRVARINPQTGQVVGWIDLTGLLTAEEMLRPVDVLNGIAYDAEGGRLFVTGKLWSNLFEIALVPRSQPTASP